ncbi:MAG: M23 family metallopeptidase [Maricaulaceae bacterium]|nr:M23 family metallopeptidase [Maricaulaceae bacterium]
MTEFLEAEATLPRAAAVAAASIEAGPLRCEGRFVQGALLVCRTAPGARVELSGQHAFADAEGWAVLGLGRDEPEAAELRVHLPDGTRFAQAFTVEQRDYDIQSVTGVPQRTVTPPEEDLALIRRQAQQKAAAFRSMWTGSAFTEGFIIPAQGRISGVYGSQRIYNGRPGNPHYGLDYAAPTGSPVIAPAGGVVTLAETDMYFEGGLIFLDHGQGLVSVFMHLSEVGVEVGDIIEQGQRIGAIGATGRATGPHLDWRVKWRDRYVDPALMLELDLASLR